MHRSVSHEVRNNHWKSFVNGDSMSKAGVHLVVWGMGLLLLLGTAVNAEISADPLKTAEAVKTDARIRIDGTPDENGWNNAAATTGFRQLEPDEGQAASESTLVRILYDDEAIYIGFWCYDTEPDKIIKQLTRRDRPTESDRVAVKIDSHHDHQTAYYFSINAAGVLRDVLIFNNSESDGSWDAVWEADAKMMTWGWSAEFKIPYSALRFSESEKYTWGLDISRYITRKNETAVWQFVPNSVSRGVSRYGHLVGIEGIRLPGRVETLPYVVSSGVTEPKTLAGSGSQEFMSDIGVNFKYGITSSTTLDAAINPDFGQVESDRSVINLTTHETYFEEKRPFFVEGTDIFRTPFINQFYSRRIGRRPTGDIDGAEHTFDEPENTTLLSAVKLTGKTNSGTAFGLFNVTTQKETAKYRLADDPNTYEAVIEPLANYSVIRARQDILGNSYVGGMVTTANQKDRSDAFTASADWRLYFLDQRFSFSGIAIGTNNGPGTGDMGTMLSLDKSGGKLIRGNIYGYYIGPQADWNRMGFMERNSARGFNNWIQLYSNKRFSIFRNMNINFNYWYNENLDGYRGRNGGNVNGSVSFTNNWTIWAGVGYDGSRYDDRETRNNGLWYVDSDARYWAAAATNPSKPISFDINYHHDNEKDGLFYLYEFTTCFKPLSNFEFSVGTHYTINRGVDFWVGTGEDGLPVFGKIDNSDLDLTSRGTYTFTRNLSLQWYTQVYFSAGEYNDFRRLTSPYRLEDVPESYEISFAKSDFNYNSFKYNLVLRWEYLPGSALYLVWTQSREGYRSDYGDFQFSRDFRNLMDIPETNTFLVKANYWWNI